MFAIRVSGGKSLVNSRNLSQWKKVAHLDKKPSTTLSVWLVVKGISGVLSRFVITFEGGGSDFTSIIIWY